jgi:hypothetical protein
MACGRAEGAEASGPVVGAASAAVGIDGVGASDVVVASGAVVEGDAVVGGASVPAVAAVAGAAAESERRLLVVPCTAGTASAPGGAAVLGFPVVVVEAGRCCTMRSNVAADIRRCPCVVHEDSARHAG